MEKIVLASGNAKKLAEMQRLLEPLDIQVVAQSEFSVPEAEETGTTFVENAIIKARNASKYTGLPAPYQRRLTRSIKRARQMLLMK